MNDATALTELMCARICHDLISPLGAIGNGIELFLMAGREMSPEFALIAESAANANARIRFFRVAFGQASEGRFVDNAEIHAILTDISRAGRLKVQWNHSGAVPRSDVKLVFLAVLCLETALPQGGTILIRAGENGWRVIAESRAVRIDTTLWTGLDGGPDPRNLTATQIQFALLPAELRRLGRRARMEYSETGIEIAL